MNLHVWRAKDQPATRFFIDLSTFENGSVKSQGFWETHPGNRLLRTMCCKKRRPARNLVAHSYFDGTWFYCVKGKGCKA